jgi:hypothetical protein
LCELFAAAGTSDRASDAVSYGVSCAARKETVRMSVSTTETVDRATIANDFSESARGKLPDHAIEAAVNTLKAAETAYAAHGSVASMIFYLRFGVTVNGGKNFQGDAGGLASPGGGALFGDVYTDNLARLYSDTRSFQFTATPVYTSLLFFDGSSNLLGHFQAGAVSIVTGTGGGSGRWS